MLAFSILLMAVGTALLMQRPEYRTNTMLFLGLIMVFSGLGLFMFQLGVQP